MTSSRIAIIYGEFHAQDIADMLDEARTAAAELGLTVVSEVGVPGSLEKPLELKKELLRDDVDGAVVLGIIERGETAHGLVMGQCVTTAILDIQLELMKPVGMGILGPEIFPSQIRPRTRSYSRAAVNATAKMLNGTA